jgi:hypothetical protein
LEGLQRTPEAASLRSMGIVAVYRARRLTVGKYRSFAPAQPL